MPQSDAAMREIAKVVRRHVDQETIEQIVDELYLAALCRPPTAKERATVLAIWSESAKDVPKRQLVAATRASAIRSRSLRRR